MRTTAFFYFACRMCRLINRGGHVRYLGDALPARTLVGTLWALHVGASLGIFTGPNPVDARAEREIEWERAELVDSGESVQCVLRRRWCVGAEVGSLKIELSQAHRICAARNGRCKCCVMVDSPFARHCVFHSRWAANG